MDLKLNLDRLTTSPSEFVFETSKEWWQERVRDAQESDYEVVEPFCFELRAYKMGNEIYLEGTGHGTIDLECGRCLSRYRLALRDDFRLVLEKAGGRIPPDPEGVESLARDGLCLTDEIETGWYRGSEIRLDEFLSEVIALAIPIQPACSEDCPGLCPSCGAKIGDPACDCIVDVDVDAGADEPAKKKSPFAVLAKLRDEPTGGK